MLISAPPEINSWGGGSTPLPPGHCTLLISQAVSLWLVEVLLELYKNCSWVRLLRIWVKLCLSDRLNCLLNPWRSVIVSGYLTCELATRFGKNYDAVEILSPFTENIRNQKKLKLHTITEHSAKVDQVSDDIKNHNLKIFRELLFLWKWLTWPTITFLLGNYWEICCHLWRRQFT